MIAERAAVFAVLLLLTAIAPYRSLFLFVVISPWSVFASDVLGWDPRLGWSLLLALRASVLPYNRSTQYLPRSAIWGVIAFSLISYFRLQIGTAQIPAEELSSASVALFYFVSGMCGCYAILKFTNTRKNMIQLAFSCAWSLLIASGFGLFQAIAYYAAGSSAARIEGTTGNPNSSAAHLALGTTLMLLCWRLKLPGRHLYLLSVFTGAATCILTFSRMGTIACLLGLALTVQLTRTGKAINWKVVAASIIVLTLTAGLARSYLANMRNTLPYSGNALKTEVAMVSQEAEDLTRLEAVQFALEQFLEQPVFGVGFSTIAERNYAANGLYVTTHDTYAQVLAGTGVVGGALIILVIVSAFRSVPISMKKYAVPVWAELAFCSFFADFLQSIEILVTLAILIAILRCHGAPPEGLLSPFGVLPCNATYDPNRQGAVCAQ